MEGAHQTLANELPKTLPPPTLPRISVAMAAHKSFFSLAHIRRPACPERDDCGKGASMQSAARRATANHEARVGMSASE
jgi:hypothetical protein